MSMPHHTVPLPLTLHISEEAREKLTQRAAASGADLDRYVSAIVEQNTRGSLNLEELSGPVFKRFLESGTTDEQLSEELEQGKHELRAQRRARRAS
jgi:hypothetical protein